MNADPAAQASHHPDRYSKAAQALHWLTAVLVVAAFVLGPEGPESLVYAAASDTRRQWHETLGSCVFALTVARMLWRLMDQRPDPVPVSRWMGFAARAVQSVLVLLLFAVPITAVVGAWLSGHPITWLGGVEMSPLIAPSHERGASIAELHGLMGDAVLWIAGAHAAAAIWHHAIARDAVLASMLPAWLLKAPARKS